MKKLSVRVCQLIITIQQNWEANRKQIVDKPVAKKPNVTDNPSMDFIEQRS